MQIDIKLYLLKTFTNNIGSQCKNFLHVYSYPKSVFLIASKPTNKFIQDFESIFDVNNCCFQCKLLQIIVKLNTNWEYMKYYICMGELADSRMANRQTGEQVGGEGGQFERELVRNNYNSTVIVVYSSISEFHWVWQPMVVALWDLSVMPTVH